MELWGVVDVKIAMMEKVRCVVYCKLLVSKKGAVGSNGVSTLQVEQGCPQAHIYDPAGELTLKDVIKEITPFELQSAQASMIVSAKVDVMISSSSQKRRVERSWLVVTSVERPDRSCMHTCTTANFCFSVNSLLWMRSMIANVKN